MNRLTVLETAILGLLVGVVAAAYLTFAMGSGGFVGTTLYWVSLLPVARSLPVGEGMSLAASFAFFVLLYTLYGAVLGAIAGRLGKASVIIVAALLAVTGFAVYQQIGRQGASLAIEDPFTQTASVQMRQKPQKQYFGNEARGDLNGDRKEDVAFLIRRTDDEDGDLYYLTGAIQTENGHEGLNLLFLGYDAKPRSIEMTDGTIEIGYVDDADEPLTYRAEYADGALREKEEEAATTTEAIEASEGGN